MLLILPLKRTLTFVFFELGQQQNQYLVVLWIVILDYCCECCLESIHYICAYPLQLFHQLSLSKFSFNSPFPHFGSQETLIIKPPKKSPLLLRMTVLVFAVVFGVYICSICLKQLSIQTMTRFQSIKVIARPCHDTKLLEIPYKHYPMPETFSR